MMIPCSLVLVVNLYVCVCDVVVGVVDCQVVEVGCGCRRCSCYVAQVVGVDPAVRTLFRITIIINHLSLIIFRWLGPAMITLVSLVLPWC